MLCFLREKPSWTSITKKKKKNAWPSLELEEISEVLLFVLSWVACVCAHVHVKAFCLPSPAL